MFAENDPWLKPNISVSFVCICVTVCIYIFVCSYTYTYMCLCNVNYVENWFRRKRPVEFKLEILTCRTCSVSVTGYGLCQNKH